MITPAPAFVVAVSLAVARNSAVIDWGWRSVGTAEFETPRGERVKYAGEGGDRDLLGLPLFTRIYLGHAWWHRRDADLLREHARAGRLILLDGAGKEVAP